MWEDVAHPDVSVAVVHRVFPPPRQAVSCERDSKTQKDCCDALPMSNKCEFKESLSEISQTTEVAPGASIHKTFSETFSKGYTCVGAKMQCLQF